MASRCVQICAVIILLISERFVVKSGTESSFRNKESRRLNSMHCNWSPFLFPLARWIYTVKYVFILLLDAQIRPTHKYMVISYSPLRRIDATDGKSTHNG